MKLIERIRWISEHMDEPCLVVRGDEFKKVEKAVEKRDPVVPYFDGRTWRCGYCSTAVGYYVKITDLVEAKTKHEFCSVCGQRQDWSDINTRWE